MPVGTNLKKLFSDARAMDEFEFVRTLINYRGPDTTFRQSPLFEWFDAIIFYERMYRNDGQTLHEKARFALMTYATFFEPADLYIILGNLSRIVLGHQATPYLYWNHEKSNRWMSAAAQISLVDEILIDSGFGEIEKFFRENHFEQIRHAFFHSTYAFDGDDYIMHDVEPLYINFVGHSNVSLTEFIFPRVETILEFFHSFRETFIEHFNSYRENKIVQGRMPTFKEIEILGSSDGLTGFKDSDGNSIELRNDVWTAKNTDFDQAIHVERYVNEELTRLNAKADIYSDDGALQHLYEVVVERNVQRERENLGDVFARLGDIFFAKTAQEKNHFKMFKQRDIVKAFYEKMSELNPRYAIHVNKSLLKYVMGSNTGEGVKPRKEALSELIESLKKELKPNVLTSIPVIMKSLKDYGNDINAEKRKALIILNSNIPPELAGEVEKAKTEINKL